MLGNHYLSSSHFLSQMSVLALVWTPHSYPCSLVKALFYLLSQTTQLSPLAHRLTGLPHLPPRHQCLVSISLPIPFNLLVTWPKWIEWECNPFMTTVCDITKRSSSYVQLKTRLSHKTTISHLGNRSPGRIQDRTPGLWERHMFSPWWEYSSAVSVAIHRPIGAYVSPCC